MSETQAPVPKPEADEPEESNTFLACLATGIAALLAGILLGGLGGFGAAGVVGVTKYKTNVITITLTNEVMKAEVAYQYGIVVGHEVGRRGADFTGRNELATMWWRGDRLKVKEWIDNHVVLSDIIATQAVAAPGSNQAPVNPIPKVVINPVVKVEGLERPQ